MNIVFSILSAALTTVQPGDLPRSAANSSSIGDIKNILFGIIGALALLMIVISGLRYITSAGDPQGTSKAKNGIIFALIGLMLAILADAIVSFAVKKL